VTFYLKEICQTGVPEYIYSDGLRAGRPRFDSREGKGIFLYSTAFRPALGSTQPPIQEILSPRVEQLGRQADHSSPSTAEIKNDGVIPPLPPVSLSHAVSLLKRRNNFTIITVYIYTQILLQYRHSISLAVK
jgi:hypothetical protein